ncbi:MAG: hypothetical protein RBS80_00920 [Thermoguttaceae bacterium]|nr:hypothetical protein [Thermoguttaceae bacterium]
MRRMLWCALLAFGAHSSLSTAEDIRCDGEFRYHLQGFTADDEAIYWSFTTVLVKTDKAGGTIRQRDVPSHHGDCCIHDGILYVAVDRKFAGAKDEKYFIYLYNCEDLSFIQRIAILEDGGGVDGIEFVEGFFYVAEGKPRDSEQEFNLIHKFTPDFREKITTYKVPGKTSYGVQAMTYAGGYFWLGTYGLGTIQTDGQFHVIAENLIGAAVGIYPLPPSDKGEVRLMIAKHIKKDSGMCTATAAPAVFRGGRLVWEK